MRKKLRPDVASDTSRRNNNCVPTQHQIRRDENEGTNSHNGNMAIPGAFPRIAIRTFTLSINHLHIQNGNMAIKTTHSNFFIFSSPV